MLNSALKRFRSISAIEGLSYLILVFIAMPIKYLGNDPYYVKVFGMAHGVLFILFMISLFEAKIKESWDTGFMFQLFVLSLIPFGAFIIENRVKPKEAKQNA
ncbi:DUF3817 domain-containing protein [Arcobacter sp. LA11]|uniref:DUF3817 domain-containing protein n=1 Tax=Arcobacter sp. LA11 TaxID=1898176 RepID=UPI000933FF2F|nr:DUF3817 domain-containing protein [Arcobacter sp. LA11]